MKSNDRSDQSQVNEIVSSLTLNNYVENVINEDVPNIDIKKLNDYDSVVSIFIYLLSISNTELLIKKYSYKLLIIYII